MEADVRDAIAEIIRIRVSLSIWWHVQHRVLIFCFLVPTSRLLIRLNECYILLSFLIFNLFSNTCSDRGIHQVTRVANLQRSWPG